MRLLIVEDEKQICDTIAKSLYDAGYEVDTCYDGEEALECILAEDYDLIVLDLNLPGMDGMDILRELRQKNEETKVLILSARGQIADKVEGLDAGANDYMEKPFHLQYTWTEKSFANSSHLSSGILIYISSDSFSFPSPCASTASCRESI